MTEPTTPEPQLNRAGRRLEARRLRKTGALMAAIPAAFGTTALVVGATTTAVGAATTWTVTNLDDTNDGTCDSDCSLREALDQAQDGDTIVFDAALIGTMSLDGTTYGSLVIDHAVTISGPGAADIAIDGNSNYRVFYINLVDAGTEVTISGLTIQNGSTSNNGGGIYDADADLTLDAVTMSSNRAGANGGAVWLSNPSRSLTITGSTFTDNTATDDGGAVGTYLVDALSVTGSTFTDNTAYYDDGGAIAAGSVGSTVTVTDSTFTGNAARSGGGYYYGHGGYGGAIYVGSHSGFTISGSTFTENFAYVDGGAVFDSGGTALTITNSTFTDNSVDGYDGGAVGANSDTTDVTGSTFTGNSTDDEGGALYVSNSDAVVTVTDSTFTENTSGNGGGAIAVDSGASLSVTGSSFMGNQTLYGGDGSAVYVDDGDTVTTISNSTFTDNTADSSGAVTVESGASIAITDSTFTGNLARDNGGALYFEDSDLEVSISGSTITDNTAYDSGGGISVDTASSFTMTTTTVSGNVAMVQNAYGDPRARGGGGIYFGDVYGAAQITNSTISGNSAAGDGGGILESFVYDGLTVYNSTISGNTADGEGGAAFLTNWYYEGVTSYTSSLTLTQTTVTGNVATTVGGVAIDDANVQPDARAEAQDDDAKTGKTQKRSAGATEAPDTARVHAKDVKDPSTLTLNGTILALNSGADVGTTGTVKASSSLFGTISGTTLVDQGGNLQGANPLLGPLQDNGGPTQTHALLDGSPAINAGPDPLTPFPGSDDDQRGPGYDRVIGGRVDIGAFEAQPTNIEPTFTG